MLAEVQLAKLSKRKIPNLLIALIFTLPVSAMSTCPDLSNLYQILESDPQLVQETLSESLENCYENSEYFAIRGAVQLSIGDLFQALESLERALLLDPENGSAAVDYAEILFRQGQVLAALEMNSQLLAREDLPEGLTELMKERQRIWQSYRSDTNIGFGLYYGHDNNLNSAPLGEQLTLTLSGQPVSLDVSPEFRATPGSYASLLAGVTRSTQGFKVNSRISGLIRGRFSENSRYEIVQANSLYSVADSSENPRWAAVVGLDHLNFGGRGIYSSSTARAGYAFTRFGGCSIGPTLALQYQLFHQQSLLSGFESSLGGEINCQFSSPAAIFNRFSMTASVVNNRATQSGRLGSDRDGWRLNLSAQKRLGRGLLLAQYVRTELTDETGYSPIFDYGAKRRETLDSVYFRYLQPLPLFGRTAQFVASLYHHSQRSSIELFKTRGTTGEIGISWGI